MKKNRLASARISVLILISFAFMAIATSPLPERTDVAVDISVDIDQLKLTNQSSFDFTSLKIDMDGFLWKSLNTFNLKKGSQIIIPLADFKNGTTPITSTGLQRTVLISASNYSRYGDLSSSILY